MHLNYAFSLIVISLKFAFTKGIFGLNNELINGGCTYLLDFHTHILGKASFFILNVREFQFDCTLRYCTFRFLNSIFLFHASFFMVGEQILILLNGIESFGNLKLSFSCFFFKLILAIVVLSDDKNTFML